MKRLMQWNQTIDNVFLQIISDNLIKKNFLKFDANWVNELIKKKRLFCVFKSFVKNHRRQSEYENDYICCLSLFTKWWKNFRKIKSRNLKRYIETL